MYVAFTNTGTVRVRRGVLSVGGDYHQTATGTLAVPMRGTTPGTNFGQLQISGTAFLDGILKLEPTFTPALGNTFDVITYGVRSGSFGSVQGASIDSTRVYRAHYEATGVTLVVESPAAPANHAITVSKTVSLELSKPNPCSQNFGPACTTPSEVTVSAPAYGGHPNASVMIVLCNRQVLTEPNVDGTGGDGDPLGACDFGNGLGVSGSINLDASGNLPGPFTLQLPSDYRLTGIDGQPSPNTDGLCPPTSAQLAAGWTCSIVVAEFDPSHPGRTPAAVGFKDVFVRSPVPTLQCGGAACPNPTTPGTVVTMTGVRFPCKVITPDNPATSTYDGLCSTRWGAAGDLTVLLKNNTTGALTAVTPKSVVTNVNGNYTVTFTMPALTTGSGLYKVFAHAGACSGACQTANFNASGASLRR